MFAIEILSPETCINLILIGKNDLLNILINQRPSAGFYSRGAIKQSQR